MTDDTGALQKATCAVLGAKFTPALENDKLGISSNVKSDLLPINGLRHLPSNGTCGWFIWAGEELLTKPDFFVPIHVLHLGNWCPDVVKYLGLPPGWRFLLSGDCVDVWFDESLLVE